MEQNEMNTPTHYKQLKGGLLQWGSLHRTQEESVIVYDTREEEACCSKGCLETG
jgi:hypothetical protein